MRPKDYVISNFELKQKLVQSLFQVSGLKTLDPINKEELEKIIFDMNLGSQELVKKLPEALVTRFSSQGIQYKLTFSHLIKPGVKAFSKDIARLVKDNSWLKKSLLSMKYLLFTTNNSSNSLFGRLKLETPYDKENDVLKIIRQPLLLSDNHYSTARMFENAFIRKDCVKLNKTYFKI